MERAGVRWTKEEDNIFIKEIEEGIQVEEIALKHKRTPHAIHMRKIQKAFEELTNNGREMNDEQILKKYGVQSFEVKKFQNEIEKKKKKKNDNEIDYQASVNFLSIENDILKLENRITQLEKIISSFSFVHNNNDDFSLEENDDDGMFGYIRFSRKK